MENNHFTFHDEYRIKRRRSRLRSIPGKFDYQRWQVERERSQIDSSVTLPEPPFKEANHVGDFLNNALSRIGIQFSANEQKIQNEWKNIVGEEIAKRTMPGSLKGSLLEVYVMGAVWLNELKRNRMPEMLKRINETCGANTVKTLKLIAAPSGYKKK